MTEYVSQLRHARINDAVSLFIILNETVHKTRLHQTLNTALRHFEATGIKSRVVREDIRHDPNCLSDFTAKAWPEQTIQRILEEVGRTERIPFMLIINVDFSTFDPQEHDWRIVWFSDARRPQIGIPQLFDVLQRGVERQQNCFEFLDQQTAHGNTTAEFGSVSSRDKPGVAQFKKKIGRPGISVHEEAITSTCEKLIKEHGINLRSRGARTRLAHLLQREIPDLKQYKIESIRARLARKM